MTAAKGQPSCTPETHRSHKCRYCDQRFDFDGFWGHDCEHEWAYYEHLQTDHGEHGIAVLD